MYWLCRGQGRNKCALTLIVGLLDTLILLPRLSTSGNRELLTLYTHNKHVVIICELSCFLVN